MRGECYALRGFRGARGMWMSFVCEEHAGMGFWLSMAVFGGWLDQM